MALRATQEVEDLVKEVLATIPVRGHDITDQVCLAIENNPEWRKRYDDLVAKFEQTSDVGRDIVNNWIGRYTKRITGMSVVRKNIPAKSTIIKSYSELR